MADLKYIKRDTANDVAIITFARPKHNIMNIAMMNEINGELQSILSENSLKCLVIEAEGPSWCAGVEVSDHKPDNVQDMISTFGRMFQLIHKLEIPTIAAVNGACLGGGMEMAISCDIIIASSDAIFGQPEIKLGFFPPYAAIRLPTLVGRARAIEICTTGRRYDATEALQMGMISMVSKSSDKKTLTASVEAMLHEIRACSPLIIRLNKRAITACLDKEFDYAFAQANELFLNTLMKTEDVLEGVASFEQRRRPLWLNK